MPFDSSPVVLTVSRRGARRQPKHFPQLATQIRCSSGYTHAPSGRLQLLGGVARPKAPEPAVPAAISDQSAAAVMDALRDLAPTGEMLAPTAMARLLGPTWSRLRVEEALRWLAAVGLIRLETARDSHDKAWWLVELVREKEILRTAKAPAGRGPR